MWDIVNAKSVKGVPAEMQHTITPSEHNISMPKVEIFKKIIRCDALAEFIKIVDANPQLQQVDGYPLIHFVAACDSPKIFSYMLKSGGAASTLSPFGETLLHMCCEQQSFCCLAQLVTSAALEK